MQRRFAGPRLAGKVNVSILRPQVTEFLQGGVAGGDAGEDVAGVVEKRPCVVDGCVGDGGDHVGVGGAVPEVGGVDKRCASGEVAVGLDIHGGQLRRGLDCAGGGEHGE